MDITPQCPSQKAAHFIAGNGSRAQPRCSPSTLKLAQADLERSGLSLDQADAEGMFPTDDASAACPDFAAAPAIIIAYYDARGLPVTYERDGRAHPFCRARYLARPGFPLRRAGKYGQPAGSGTPPFFPRCFDWRQFENGQANDVCWVEGEKKAIALCRAGIPAVAIGGVWNFGDGSASLHPALAALASACEHVRIVFDSDVAEKPHIQLAEWRLAGQVALLGSHVHIVRLPADGADKTGADDYLLAHGHDAIMELILNAPALGEPEAQSSSGEVSVAELLRREVAPVEELIPGWIEKGIPNFIAGPGGVHKSRLAMQWGLSLNAGAAVWGLDATLGGLREPRAILVFCAAEDDENELARRAQAISRALKLKSPKQGIFIARKGADSALVVMHEDGRAEARPFYHQLLQRLRSIRGHKLVVLDSAYDFVRFAGHAKIVEDVVNYFIKVVLQGISDHTDSTLLIPWHPSQAGSGRKEMDGWSVAWHNAARARLGLSAVDDVENTYELEVVKRNHGPKGRPLRLKFHEGALLPVDALPDDAKDDMVSTACVEAAVYAAHLGAPFKKQPKIASKIVQEISRTAGMQLTSDRIKQELAAAEYAGRLCYREGYGKTKAGYVPAPQPPTEPVETEVETVLRPEVETR
jgi:hypothetical protein